MQLSDFLNEIVDSCGLDSMGHFYSFADVPYLEVNCFCDGSTTTVALGREDGAVNSGYRYDAYCR